MEAIGAIRNIRAEADAKPSKALRAVILAEGEKMEIIKGGGKIYQRPGKYYGN